MATPTYTPIASITLGSSASSVEFSSIPQDYRDLVLVMAIEGASSTVTALRLNADTGSNYSIVNMTGNGSSAASTTSNTTFLNLFTGINSSSGDIAQLTAQIMDYSATDKHKSALGRGGQVNDLVSASAGRWADTSALTSIEVITVFGGDFQAGSTFALYGIEA